MGFDDIKNKISDLASGNKDKLEEGIDKAKDFVDDKTGGKLGDKADDVTDKAKGFLNKDDE